MYATTKIRSGGLEPTEQHHWFGTTNLPGEPTQHPALRIVPDVQPAPDGTSHQIRWTGGWRLAHVPTGHAIRPGRALPLDWLKRFARLLATCGVDWNQVSGETSHVDHPQYVLIRAIGDYVLDCWVRGVPVGPGIGITLRAATDGDTRMYCGNRNCEDGYAPNGEPAQLLGFGEDGQDEAHSSDVDELYEIARESGWRDLGRGMWLCETCAATHQPAPPHVAQRLSE